jgi:hypothetical protein
MNISSDLNQGKLVISDKFEPNAATQSVNASPSFSNLGDEYILAFPEIQNVKKLDRFFYDTIGLTDGRFLLNYYRISRDGQNWSEWLDLTLKILNFPLIDPLDPFYLEIKWIRKGVSTIGIIKILEYNIQGELQRPIQEEDGTSIIPVGKTLIIKPPFIFKVFRISDIEIISSTGIPEDCKISYRFSQDSSRTWSDYELFTKENIRIRRINPIRFFEIEYLIENNSNQSVTIQDINLLGAFQNVSEDSKKTNLFGIRQCCQSNLMGAYDENGIFIPNTNLDSGSSGGPGCDPLTSSLPQMTTDEKSNLFNPYQQSQAMNLLQKLSNDAQTVFGHRVLYYATDPDKKGQDTILHEYQLYNVVCEGELKVSVENNQFPDSQIVMNQFDLNLFETFQVHITKQQFKEVFGVQRRPAKEDFLYFCDLNRMYSVDHAQQFRNFNNAAVYYKLVLKKYNKTANIDYANETIKQSVESLTKNTTIDELFGFEDRQEKKAIANKKQFKPLTTELIRLEYKATINKELIENSSTIISKSHYDLSSIPGQTGSNYNGLAVRYVNFNPILTTVSNLGFMCWFNLNNYVSDEVYNFLSYYNYKLNIGYKFELQNDDLRFTLNGSTYTQHLMGQQSNNTIALEEDTWYCYVLNIDQRNKKAEQFIYKRDVDEEDEAANLSYTMLRQLYKQSFDIEQFEFESEGFNPEILGSDMKMTNIRLFTQIIPEKEHNKICNQYIIRDDSKYLIFADNATTRLYLPRFPLFE